MKKYIFLAASALTLASCTSDDFLGNTPGSTPTSANSAIKFDGNAGKISRATSNTASTPQGKLDYQFKIYGVKSGANNNYSKVFENYSIWYNTTKTTSNTNDWEYVAGAGVITTGETANPRCRRRSNRRSCAPAVPAPPRATSRGRWRCSRPGTRTNTPQAETAATPLPRATTAACVRSSRWIWILPVLSHAPRATTSLR